MPHVVLAIDGPLPEHRRVVPLLTFASAVRRQIECPSMNAPGRTVGDVLEAYFQAHPRVRGYVLDEQGVVRHHVAIFIDGVMLRSRRRLDESVEGAKEIHVMQALSGG